MAGGLGLSGRVRFFAGQAGVDHRVDEACLTLEAAVNVDVGCASIKGIEPYLDALTDQMRGRFVKPVLQKEGRVTANHAGEPVEEQAAHVGCRWDLPDLLDVALPAQERGRAQRAVRGGVRGAVEPAPDTGVEYVQRGGSLALLIGQ